MTEWSKETSHVVLDQLEAIMTKEVKESIDWTQSDENQGTWPRKSKVSLCLLQSTGIMMMIEGLNMVKEDYHASKEELVF